MTDRNTDALLRSLGIDTDYGNNPFRPSYPEAKNLIDVEPNVLGRMQQLTPHTASAWLDMKAAAARDEVTLLLVSGYRSIAYQAELFQRKLASGQSLSEILAVNAAPGFSQHHTGETVDVATPGARPLTQAFETTQAFAWLTENATAFKFRMPYDKSNPFGFAYEPWHWTRIPA